jgi:hypothetical protein
MPNPLLKQGTRGHQKRFYKVKTRLRNPLLYPLSYGRKMG